MNNLNIDKILISNKVLFCKKGFKHLIGNKDEDKIKALCLMLAKTSGYAKSFDETKHMFFFILDKKLLKTNNKTWDKISNIKQKRFDKKPVCDEKYLKTEIKSYFDKINRNVHNKGMPKEGCHFVCLSEMLIDSVFCYGQKLLSKSIRRGMQIREKINKFVNYE